MLWITNGLAWGAWASIAYGASPVLNESGTRSILAFAIIAAAIHVGVILYEHKDEVRADGHLCHRSYWAMCSGLIHHEDEMIDLAAAGGEGGPPPVHRYAQLDLTLVLFQIFHIQQPIHMFSTLPLFITEAVMVGGGDRNGLLIVSLGMTSAMLFCGFVFLMGAGDGMALSDGLCDIIGGARALEVYNVMHPNQPPVTNAAEVVAFMHRINAYPSREKLGRMNEADSRNADPQAIRAFLIKKDASAVTMYYTSCVFAALGLGYRFSAPLPPEWDRLPPLQPAAGAGGGGAPSPNNAVGGRAGAYHSINSIPGSGGAASGPPPPPPYHNGDPAFVGVHQRVFSGDGGPNVHPISASSNPGSGGAVVHDDAHHIPTTIDMRNIAPPPESAQPDNHQPLISHDMSAAPLYPGAVPSNNEP